MYKNFNITESEKEEILNRLKENGYGQPINEQKVGPVQKPVVAQPKQQSVDNVPPQGQRYSGKSDPKLVQNLNMLKEVVGSYVNKIQAYVPKTIQNGGLVMNVENLSNFFQVGFTPKQNYQGIFRVASLTNVGGDSVMFSTIDFTIHFGWNNQSHHDGSIVDVLVSSKDINELYQNLSKYAPEVYARQEMVYGTKELSIEMNVTKQQPMESRVLFDQIKRSNNAASLYKIIQSVFPNITQSILTSFNEAKYQASRNKDSNTVRDTMKYIDNELNSFMEFVNQKPKENTQQPTQGQQPQQPLNEGQEILKDVFKSLLK